MRTVLFAILIVAAALLQIAGVHIIGITPNFFLAVIFIAALATKDFVSFGIIMLVGLIAMRFQPGISWQSLLLAGFGFLIYWVKTYLSWLEIFTVIFGLALLTVLFYLIIDTQFLFQNYPVVFIEALYNIGIGSALFVFLPASQQGGPRAHTRK